MGMYDGMLPVKQKEGYRGYYPVTNKEEWDELPDLYKTMEWTPILDPFDKNQRLRAVKNVIFDVTYMEPYGIRAEVSVHPQEIQQLLFCHHKKKDCQLYTICGIELEGGSRLPAKWLQDTITGAFAIYAADKYVAKQGGFYGFIPEHIIVQEDGSYKFDFKYGVGKTTHYTNLNPFRNEPVKEKEADCTKQLMDAMSAYGLENGWSDNDIIDALVDCGIKYDDFKKYGKEDFVKGYFEEKETDMVVMHGYVCKCCGKEIHEDKDNEDWFDEFGEEELWGHLQMKHEEIFKECQNWETPAMLEEYYNEISVALKGVQDKEDIKNLRDIINENIEWFWNNDPMLEHEADLQNLWNRFRAWCIQNCKEVFKDLDERIVEKEVDFSYLKWKVSNNKKLSLDEKIAGADNIKSDLPKKETVKINKDDKTVEDR